MLKAKQQTWDFKKYKRLNKEKLWDIHNLK